MLVERGLARVHRERERGAREGEIEAGQYKEVRVDLGRVLRSLRGEFREHAPRLALDREIRLLLAVVELDHRFGLDEQRGSGGRSVVHDAGDARARVRAHRQHVAIAAQRDEGILQRARDVAVAEEALDALLRGNPEFARGAASVGERGRCRVGDAAVRIERALDLRGERGVIDECACDCREARREFRAAREEARGLGAGAQRGRDVEQLHACEPAAAREPRQQRVDVARAGGRCYVAGIEDRLRLSRLAELLARAAQIWREKSGAKHVERSVRPWRAQLRAEAQHELRPLEPREGLFGGAKGHGRELDTGLRLRRQSCGGARSEPRPRGYFEAPIRR